MGEKWRSDSAICYALIGRMLYHKMGVFPLRQNNRIISCPYLLLNSGLVMNLDASRLLEKRSVGGDG